MSGDWSPQRFGSSGWRTARENSAWSQRLIRRQARHFVRTALDAVAVAEPPLETAILLASELVTNAFPHVRTEIVVRYLVGPTVVRVEVTDGNTMRPSAANAPADAMAGRGLGIVSALASRRGVDPVADGKSVWV